MHHKVLELNYLKPWIEFRQTLEISSTPFEDVAEYFERLPKARVYTDPYDFKSWPTPWELIVENVFCPFNIVLGICYTLQLTERFKNIKPKINVAVDISNKTVYYLLIIDDKVYGYRSEDWCSLNDLPKSLIYKKTYDMVGIQ